MAQLFNIVDDKVVINKLALKYLEGPVIHAGTLDIIGNTSVQSNLSVKGAIVADTITVKKLITEEGINPTEPGNWVAESEDDLNGKGFNWEHPNRTARLAYRTGGRIWSNSSIDIDNGCSYKVDNINVLSANELGSTVTKSNLREVGPLKSLNVTGDVSVGGFAFFKNTYGRLGLGTEEPNASISIVENDVEIAIGSPKYGVANIGTVSNHEVAIISDNIPRIVVKNSGDVVIGDEIGKSGVLRVYGELYAESIITDNRLERSSSLEFKATRETSVFNKGLVWSGNGATKHLIMRNDPDRLFSSESFDIGVDQSYHINGQVVLSSNSLGRDVVNSNLTNLGTLEALNVRGTATFFGDIEATTGTIRSRNIVLNDGVQGITISNAGANADRSISLSVQSSELFYADADEITIGNKQNTRRPVKLFGPVSIGTNNPDPSVGLTVSGNVSFANKKFITGNSIPTSGAFFKGDICWNTDPKPNSYIGWVCIVDGAPGEWLPFGGISR